jgi:DNA-binding CsgD family transcriptional regulator
LTRTADQLAACGLSKPSGVSHNVALTGREAEVAHLVAQGMTNAAVAAELFVTPKAVEFHLSNIFAKLGVNKRQQLLRRAFVHVETSL